MLTTVVREVQFDAAHRVMHHESKCKHLHGHRYRVEIECQSKELDTLGRVIDFGKIKEIVGTWIDKNWDHACIYNKNDVELKRYLEDNQMRRYEMASNPTAEVMAKLLLSVAKMLLPTHDLTVTRIRVYETPNCYAEVKDDASIG